MEVPDVVLLVNISMGKGSLSACVPGDRDQDGRISVAELVAAVNDMLRGCR
jgi:hypothetical protein